MSNKTIHTISNSRKTHGESNTRLYKIWNSMKQRCSNKNHPSYKDYGARGISLCEEWEDYESFRNWSLMNGYDEERGLSIERIDVNGIYEPFNCEWIPKKRQAENKRNTLYATINGRTERLIVWCHLFDLRYDSVWKRINNYGYSPEKALTHNIEKIKIKRTGNVNGE